MHRAAARALSRAVLFGAVFCRAVFVGALLVPAACERPPSGAAPHAATDPLAGIARTPATTPADQTYTVRGRINALPTPDAKQPLVIHHQTIAEFVDQDGQVIGMNEHAMAFPWLSESLTLDSAGVDDFVEITFEIRWKTKPRVLLTRVRKLPPGETVELRPVVETGG